MITSKTAVAVSLVSILFLSIVFASSTTTDIENFEDIKFKKWVHVVGGYPIIRHSYSAPNLLSKVENGNSYFLCLTGSSIANNSLKSGVVIFNISKATSFGVEVMPFVYNITNKSVPIDIEGIGIQVYSGEKYILINLKEYRDNESGKLVAYTEVNAKSNVFSKEVNLFKKTGIVVWSWIKLFYDGDLLSFGGTKIKSIHIPFNATHIAIYGYVGKKANNSFIWSTMYSVALDNAVLYYPKNSVNFKISSDFMLILVVFTASSIGMLYGIRYIMKGGDKD